MSGEAHPPPFRRGEGVTGKEAWEIENADEERRVLRKLGYMLLGIGVIVALIVTGAVLYL